MEFYALLALVLVGYFTSQTRSGRELYAIGSNPDAAVLSGIQARKRTFWLFLISGAVAGIAGVLWLAFYGAAETTSALGFEFITVTVVVVGGINIWGGSGSIRGVILGAVIYTGVTNALVIANVSVNWQQAVDGAIVLVAVSGNVLLTRRTAQRMQLRQQVVEREGGIRWRLATAAVALGREGHGMPQQGPRGGQSTGDPQADVPSPTGTLVAEGLAPALDGAASGPDEPLQRRGEKPPRAWHLVVSVVDRWEFVLLVMIVVVTIYSALTTPYFLSLSNFWSIWSVSMPVGIMMLPMIFIIMFAGINLSVASIMAVSAVVVGLLYQDGLNIWVAAIVGVFIGAGAGLLNGASVVWVGLPPLIVTSLPKTCSGA